MFSVVHVHHSLNTSNTRVYQLYQWRLWSKISPHGTCRDSKSTKQNKQWVYMYISWTEVCENDFSWGLWRLSTCNIKTMQSYHCYFAQNVSFCSIQYTIQVYNIWPQWKNYPPPPLKKRRKKYQSAYMNVSTTLLDNRCISFFCFCLTT